VIKSVDILYLTAFSPPKFPKSVQESLLVPQLKFLRRKRPMSCMKSPIYPFSILTSTHRRESVENDRTLYKLIHTKLLTATLDRPSNMPGAKHKKSLEGRILEVASAAKIGKGETTVRKEEHNKVPKHIREGIRAKSKDRLQKRIEEVCLSALSSAWVFTVQSRQRTWAIIILLSSVFLRTRISLPSAQSENVGLEWG
jgi:hypothetical protein